MARRLSPRFGFYATVLVLLGVVAILLELGRTPVLVILFAAWVAFAALELLAPPRPAPASAVADEDERQPVAGAEPFAPQRVPPDLAADGTAEAPQPLAAAPFDEPAPEPVYSFPRPRPGDEDAHDDEDEDVPA